MKLEHSVCKTLPFDLALASSLIFQSCAAHASGDLCRSAQSAQLASRYISDFLDDPQPITYSLKQTAFKDWADANFTNKPFDEIWSTLFKACLYSKDVARMGEYLSRLRHLLNNHHNKIKDSL